MERLRKLSFWIATVFILAALAIKLKGTPELQLYSNIATGVGIVFFLVSLYFERHAVKNFFSSRATRHGLNSVIMVLLVLALVGLVNWIVSRHPLKYDSTKNKTFTLSSLTKNALKNLKQPVKVTAFYTYHDETSRLKIKSLLEDYSSQSKMLQVQMIDPKKNPRLVQQYGIETNATTVIESGKQKTTISTAEEEDITNAILKVSTNKQPIVYFLQGHGEPGIEDIEASGMSSVIEALKKTNYAVKELKDLPATAKIPDDCTALVVASPRVNLIDPEINAIKDYLKAGGRAIFLYDPQADPSLQKIFDAYHIKGADDVVVDEKYHFPLADAAVPYVVPRDGTPVTKEFDVVMFFPVARSLTFDEKMESKEMYVPFAQSTEFSWGETDKQQAVFEEGKDKKGPLTIGLLVSQPVEAKQKKSNETRMIIFGDINFIQNGYINMSPGNSRIFMNSVAWLTEQENLIHLPPKDKRTDTMVLSSTQLNYLALLLIVVLPLAVLGTGITVWFRRKKL